MINDHDRCEWVNVSSSTGSPRLSWTKSREPYNGCSVVVTMVLQYGHILWTGAYQSNGQLVLPELKPTDEGRYICTIYLITGHSRVAYTTLLVSTDGQQQPGKYRLAVAQQMSFFIELEFILSVLV